MATKKPKGNSKRTQKRQAGGGMIFEGKVSVDHGDIIGGDQVIHGDYKRGDTTNIAVREELFKEIFKKIDQRPNTSSNDKADLKANVEEIKAEAAKGEKADETFLARRFRNLMRMAPDILEVVTAAITNPAAGFAKVVEKIAKRATASSGGAVS
jgi:hypothetical protein